MILTLNANEAGAPDSGPVGNRPPVLGVGIRTSTERVAPDQPEIIYPAWPLLERGVA